VHDSTPIHAEHEAVLARLILARPQHSACDAYHSLRKLI
jgi:hypothetical protein